MSFPASPPRYITWADIFAPIKEGSTGWPAYALQSCVNSYRWAEDRSIPRVEPDGEVGPDTVASVKLVQKALGLKADGIAGPATQAALISWASSRIHDLVPDVPDGLMRGLAEGEGANALAATNWSVPGGVDCGPGQIRVYTPFSQTALRAAFNTVQSLLSAAQLIVVRADEYSIKPYTSKLPNRHEHALRCAVMAHNWPAGALSIASTGRCSNPNGKCDWVSRDATGTSRVHFPDGALVDTRWDWCQFYAMGGPHGEGRIVKYVNW